MKGYLDTINRLADEAHKSCGLSHDVYVQHFSMKIDKLIQGMDDHEQAIILNLAFDQDYAIPAKLKEMEIDNKANGRCSHGLAPDCCPCGCDVLESMKSNIVNIVDSKDNILEEWLHLDHAELELTRYLNEGVDAYLSDID